MNVSRFFMGIAETARLESTCARLKVGACLTDGRYVLGTGWNGVLSGKKHCNKLFTCSDDGRYFLNGFELSEEEWLDKHHIYSQKYEIHAEINAMLNSSKKGSIMYVTTAPCNACLKQMAAYGIRQVRYRDEYDRTPVDKQYAKKLGIIIKQL